MIKEFSVKVPQKVLDDLKLRLALTRWPDALEGSGWEDGADLSFVKKLVDYWQHQFDWRNVEREINSYPNFIAEVRLLSVIHLAQLNQVVLVLSIYKMIKSTKRLQRFLKYL